MQQQALWRTDVHGLRSLITPTEQLESDSVHITPTVSQKNSPVDQ